MRNLVRAMKYIRMPLSDVLQNKKEYENLNRTFRSRINWFISWIKFRQIRAVSQISSNTLCQTKLEIQFINQIHRSTQRMQFQNMQEMQNPSSLQQHGDV